VALKDDYKGLLGCPERFRAKSLRLELVGRSPLFTELPRGLLLRTADTALLRKLRGPEGLRCYEPTCSLGVSTASSCDLSV
jgi:hypothetical protein